MAKNPKRLPKSKKGFTTAKLKIPVYNRLVALREEKESISDTVERHLPPEKEVKVEHKSCSSEEKEAV